MPRRDPLECGGFVQRKPICDCALRTIPVAACDKVQSLRFKCGIRLRQLEAKPCPLLAIENWALNLARAATCDLSCITWLSDSLTADGWPLAADR